MTPAHRRHRRVTARFPRAIRIELELDEGWRDATSVDVSLGGLCLGSTARFTMGQILALRLHLPGRPPITVRATVCWSSPETAESGLRFEDMAPEDVLAWARWLKGASDDG